MALPMFFPVVYSPTETWQDISQRKLVLASRIQGPGRFIGHLLANNRHASEY